MRPMRLLRCGKECASAWGNLNKLHGVKCQSVNLIVGKKTKKTKKTKNPKKTTTTKKPHTQDKIKILKCQEGSTLS